MDKPETAKLFMNGRSQAVRLPAKYRFKGTEVLVNRVGDNVVLSPKPDSWGEFFAAPSSVPRTFLKRRADAAPQKRRGLR